MANHYLEGKYVLVTGGTGLIGIPLVRKLVGLGARVRVVSRDRWSPFNGSVEVRHADLCSAEACAAMLDDIQVVFHLAGIKGSIGVASSRSATFLVKNVLMNTQVMEAARKRGVERFLYASSICIYPPAEVFEEKNAFSGLPHPSDRYGGMAKLVGEMQVEAYRLQYDLESFLTIRPANTYGPYDNFNAVSALIIPALICRIFQGENPLTIWGDGSAVRDFVFADDVADLMILMVEKRETAPLNAGSGQAVTIKEVAETVVRHAQTALGRSIDVCWDPSRPAGEKYRVTSIDKARSRLGWAPRVCLDEGIRATVSWFQQNRSNLPERYSILSES